MKWLLLLALFFAVEFSSFAQADSGPLQVTLLPHWSVNYTAENGNPTYKFTGPKDPATQLGAEIAFSFYKQGSPDQIAALMKDMATKAVAAIQGNSRLTVQNGTYAPGEIQGDLFSGESASVLWLESGEAYTHSQTFFIFSDGTGLWIGQYGGPPEHWSEALKMIQALRKN